jgi:hypothetical protein
MPRNQKGQDFPVHWIIVSCSASKKSR